VVLDLANNSRVVVALYAAAATAVNMTHLLVQAYENMPDIAPEGPLKGKGMVRNAQKMKSRCGLSHLS
jgi:hypothetical protein